ncbi:endonuclease/exonuclease/phosphatase family protein [Leptolyngbya sp. KIOST-1]|uniref:endonuclease/exonuclease/phosphatase family protein n=1 Tax=Leptolyngbya sp. KIOST-1 TaxID=1229172 RepID=UPI000A825551|nr:endonuclease/exonuclease/phosphatase family protein [Leptolyngbya sp. KIOST-1]
MTVNLDGTVYIQDFDGLASTGTTGSILPQGWFFFEAGTNANDTYGIGTGSSNAGNTYSFGAAGDGDRALGGLRSGTLIPTFGASFTNATDTTFAGFNISYFGEQWRLGTDNRAIPDRLDFQYSLNATALNNGTWIDVDALDFVAPVTTGGVGARDGNDAANRTLVTGTLAGLTVAPGETLWIRWSDFDAAGADDGLAVDDFTLIPLVQGGVVRPVVTIAATDAIAAEGETPVNTGTFTVTRSGDIAEALTVTYTINGTATNGVDYEALSGTVEIPAGQTSATITVTPLDDDLIEGDETVVLTLVDEADYDLGAAASATVTIRDAVPTVAIYDIQGASHISPFNGQRVITSGIVTAIDTTGSRGFYLQDPVGDGNIATSDAIFVFVGSATPIPVQVGDEVQVNGVVSEFTPGGLATRNLSITQIGGNPTVDVLSSGNPLPAATIIGQGGRVPPTGTIDDDAFTVFDPVNDGIDFFESLEGMLVTAQNFRVIDATNNFGEIFGVIDNGFGATGLSERGTLNISPDDFNPERIQLQFDSGVRDFAFPLVNVGDRLGDVTGVVSYAFGNYEILVTEDFTSQIVPSGLQPEVSPLTRGSEQLLVATYNVLNLDPNENDGDTDIADGRFDAIARQIVNNLNRPDIIALQEVQDNSGSVNDGVTAADVTLQTLINAIVAAGGPTYAFIDTPGILNNAGGGQPGGNIRNAYLYDPSRVSLVEGSVSTISSQAPGAAFAGARLPLVASFQFNGETVTLVNNHFSSKGGSAPILGTEQPFEARQEDPTVNGSLDRRQQQSLAVQNFVSDVLGADSAANVVVLGDFNEFEFVSPVRDLAANTGLTNLTELLPENERYTFIFQGNSQSLDHILVSGGLATTAEVDIVHANIEFAETPQRASDHDPILARFTLAPAAPIFNIITGTDRRDVLVGTAGNDRIFASPGPDLITTGGGRDQIVYTNTNQTGDTITDFEVGADQLVFTDLLTSVGYTGTNPLADGTIQIRNLGNSGRTQLSLELEGVAGRNMFTNFITLLGVDAAALNNPENFVF